MPSRRPPQVPKATAKSANNKRRAPRGQSERNQQWAMLTEDCGITLHAIIDTPVPEVFHQEVDTKRIWLLDGNWGEHDNLTRWADSIIDVDKTPVPINSVISVCEIKVADWPAITDIMPAGLKLLSEEAWRAWTIALENIMNGHVTEGEAALRKARLMS